MTPQWILSLPQGARRQRRQSAHDMAAHDASLHSDLRIGLQLGLFYTEPMLFGWMQFVTHCIKKTWIQGLCGFGQNIGGLSASSAHFIRALSWIDAPHRIFSLCSA